MNDFSLQTESPMEWKQQAKGLRVVLPGHS